MNTELRRILIPDLCDRVWYYLNHSFLRAVHVDKDPELERWYADAMDFAALLYYIPPTLRH